MKALFMTKILIIEDELILREEVSSWLTFEGYDALSAADGITGVETALQEPPDLILCDITMPRLDGYGVLLEIHAHLDTANIPFIFMTAKASQEEIRRGMNLGADDYITKPFTRLELLQSIETRLVKESLRQELHREEIEEFRQALEKEHEQRLLKSKLVAMFSHDFRNPLTTILSSNSLLRDYADRMDAERRLAHLNRIDTSVHQLIDMLDDMLLMAQIDSGSLKANPESINLSEFLQRMVDDAKAAHGHSHQVMFVGDIHRPAEVDPRLLRQIAGNLISNAIKYSPDGGEIHVRLENGGEQWRLSVQDHGIGIPPEDQARLFSAFQRGSNTGSLVGTGLGLAIVKQAVEVCGGSVAVESQVGVGAKFTVAIPYVMPAAD